MTDPTNAAARLRRIARDLAGPWDRLADGRELVVLTLPAGDAELAAAELKAAARYRRARGEGTPLFAGEVKP